MGKRIWMLLISMMLVLGFSLNVYASESSSTITIETQEKHEENILRLSEGEPLSMPIGYWATWDADSAVTNVTFLTTDNIHYTDSKTIEGMSFRY